MDALAKVVRLDRDAVRRANVVPDSFDSRGFALMGPAVNNGRIDHSPIAELVRRVTDRTSSPNEAVKILRRGPRACQDDDAIANAQPRSAVATLAMRDTFDIVAPNAAPPSPRSDARHRAAGRRHMR